MSDIKSTGEFTPGTDLEMGTGHEAPLFPLSPHHLRITDTDAKAARRAERQVAAMFLLSMACIIAFIVCYVRIPTDEYLSLGPAGTFQKSNFALGITFGMAILLIGIGAIHWAKKLMVEEEMVDYRHSAATDEPSRAAALVAFQEGTDESGFVQRPLIRRTLIGSLLLFPLPFIVFLRDMGPLPGDKLRKTMWTKGSHIVVDVTRQRIKPEDIPVGGLVSAQPEDLTTVEEAEGNLNARAKASIILVRMTPQEIRSQQGEGWDYQGILAFSKICTHVGCPIALYQQRTHHLLCPCHQSTFDLADSGVVVFGPANRALPQLAITVDAEGYLVARGDFDQPVGPSFWERG